MSIAREFFIVALEKGVSCSTLLKISEGLEPLTEHEKNEKLEKIVPIIKESKSDKEILEKVYPLL